MKTKETYLTYKGCNFGRFITLYANGTN